ncbi:toprim domain-containing protein [uncultured Fibrella sp.]|uniref:toprim domain-containing protein n=1 Tax=uncultured Fibrella sp. TaxID=1284596 RepID=UPI0035CABCB4
MDVTGQRNKASREQLAILRHLNRESVRYVAFGDFALNALEQTRTIGHIQLWIDPTMENLERLNTSINNMYGPRNATTVPVSVADNPEMRRMLTLGTGQVRVNLYPAIAGFEANQFANAFGRAMKGQATMIRPTGQFDGSVAYRQLGLNDLYQNVQASNSYHRAWNVELIERYAQQRNLELTPNASVSPVVNKRQPERINRNFDQIRDELDLEIVLQHYGYRVDTKKSQPNSPWRIYETGVQGDKQRLAVAALQGHKTKIFVDLNDSVNFRGDIFKFMEKMEHGNYRHIFEVVDRITMKDGYAQEKAQIPALRQIPESYFLKDTLLREQDLQQRYNIGPLTNTNYLNSRSLTLDTLYSPEFDSRIKNTAYQKDDKTIVNTAFPLYARDGRIVSLDVRNSTYKAFPEGERGEALWHSNRFYMSQREVPLTDGSQLSAGIIGTAYRSQDNQRIVFNVNGQGSGDQRIELPLKMAKELLREQPANRIVVTESAVDALSFKQLNPELEGERRLYIATAGQPGGRQVGFIQDKLKENPLAQLVIAQDGDNPGLRFAINYLGLEHPAENPDLKIKPYITYSAPARSALQEEKVDLGSQLTNSEVLAKPITLTGKPIEEGSRELLGTNRLTLEVRYPIGENAQNGQQQNEQFIGKLINDLNLFIRKYDYNNDSSDKENKVAEFQRETLLDSSSNRVITRTVIHFPNDSVLLGKVLNQLTKEVDTRQGQPLYHVVRPTRQQKDFNEVLQNRNGQPLPTSHNLRLGEPPKIIPFDRVGHVASQQLNRQVKEATTTQKTQTPSDVAEQSIKKGPSKRIG